MSGRERGVPEGAGQVEMTGPGTAAGRGVLPRTAIIGIGVLVAIAAVLLLVVLLPREPRPIGESGASPTDSASATPSEGAAPPASPDATPAPTASPVTAIPEIWTDVAVYSEPGQRYMLGDLVAWSGGLLAVGTLYETESRNVFGPPPPREGHVWRSTDGTEWTDATPAGTFVDVELMHLFEAADGALIVVGNVYPEVDPLSAAWETRDGETWTRVELAGMPEGAFVLQVASGGQGHVASTYVRADSRPLYSADGRTWEPILENAAINTLAAGDEGFVASLSSESPGSMARIVASADGLEWFDATEPDEGSFLGAPRRGDWVGVTTTFLHDEPSLAVAAWGSANGLDWSPLGQLATSSDDPFDSDCSEAPAALHGLPTMTVAATAWTFGCGEGAIVNPGASYATLDGADWVRLPFGAQAFAAGAAMIGDRVVIGTDARTGQAPVIGVTFWAGEP